MLAVGFCTQCRQEWPGNWTRTLHACCHCGPAVHALHSGNCLDVSLSTRQPRIPSKTRPLECLDLHTAIAVLAGSNTGLSRPAQLHASIYCHKKSLNTLEREINSQLLQLLHSKARGLCSSGVSPFQRASKVLLKLPFSVKR